MYNTEHYHSLRVKLINEMDRFNKATIPSEKQLREVWVKQLEKEVKGEIEFLKSKGIDVSEEISLSDDDLLNELLGE